MNNSRLAGVRLAQRTGRIIDHPGLNTIPTENESTFGNQRGRADRPFVAQRTSNVFACVRLLGRRFNLPIQFVSMLRNGKTNLLQIGVRLDQMLNGETKAEETHRFRQFLLDFVALCVRTRVNQITDLRQRFAQVVMRAG